MESSVEKPDYVTELMNQMRERYPDFKIINEEDKYSDILHTAEVFLYTKKYNAFEAKYHVRLLPAAFVGANIFQNGEFQYSLSTCSGDWNEKLKDLEEVVSEIDEKGFGYVRTKFDGDKLGFDLGEF